MFNRSENPQVVYSLTLLSDTLWELMQKYSFDDITISQICRTAYVSRNAFYRNCETKEDLVVYKIILTIHSHLKNVDMNGTDPSTLYKNFFEFWYQQKDFLLLLNMQNLFPLFNKLFNEYCIKNLSYTFLDDFLKGKKNPQNLKLFHISFLIGGLCNVLEYWVKNNFQTPIDDLINTMIKLAPTITDQTDERYS